MTKRIIFIFAALCSLQARASVRPAQADTVRYTSFTDAAELLQPVQPTHLDGVILPMRGSGNWFVGIAGGSTAFLGTLLGCEDLFGRIETSYSLAVGKWFTPSVGARINYSGSRFKDARLSTQRYHYVHADLLWNVLGRGYARQEQVRWGLVPFAGIGLLHHATNGHNPFAVSYGVQGQYRISRRVSAVAELSGTTTFQDFDGYGRANRLGDHMLSLTAGFTFHIGKTGWKRAVDAAPYIRRSERLAEYVDFLSEENRRYAGRHDCDRRTLAELKKILEIEGLLDAYGHILQEDGEVGKDYPVNNYSGLNSLRARLKNRQWDGTSPLDTTEVRPGGGSVSVRVEAGSANSRYGCNARRDSLTADSVAFRPAGGECIGAPVYFFFSLNTARLTDPSQLVNLDELVRVATKYGLTVKVTGAADSATGTVGINDALSVSRADYMASELNKRGLPSDRITKTGEGGISDYVPTEANRHSKVELFFDKLEKTEIHP